MRKSFITLSLLVAVTLVLSACSFNGVSINVNTSTIQGSGKNNSEERTVQDFTRVELKSFGNLTISQGDVESLTVKADDNLLPYITTDVVTGTLEIGTKQNTNINPTQAIEYHLTVKSLSSVTLAGFGNIDADKLSSDTLQVKLTGSGDIHIGELTGDNLNMNLTGFGNVSIDSAEVAKPTIDLSGSGDIKIGSLKATALALTISGFGNATVSGTASSETIKLTGSGNYHGGDLQSDEATVIISGFGNATVWAATDLDLRVTGSGNVEYYGDPRLSQTVTGFGKIKSLGEH
jgi:hypothetical protein